MWNPEKEKKNDSIDGNRPPNQNEMNPKMDSLRSLISIDFFFYIYCTRMLIDSSGNELVEGAREIVLERSWLGHVDESAD